MYGNIVFDTVYDSAGNITYQGSIPYKRDSHGNWLNYMPNPIITARKTKDNEPFPLPIRTITYY